MLLFNNGLFNGNELQLSMSINWSIRNLPLRCSAIFVCEAGQDLVGLLTSATVPASKALLSDAQ